MQVSSHLGLLTTPLVICKSSRSVTVMLIIMRLMDILYRGKEPKRLEEDLLKCFRINTIGNIHLFNLYMPLVLNGRVKKVITLSSGYADDSLTVGFGIDVAGPYTVSKAALNTAVAKFSAQYAEQGVLFLSIAPGAVEVGQDEGSKMH